MVYRAMWDPVDPGFRSGENAASRSDATEELTNLLSEVDTYEPWERCLLKDVSLDVAS